MDAAVASAAQPASTSRLRAAAVVVLPMPQMSCRPVSPYSSWVGYPVGQDLRHRVHEHGEAEHGAEEPAGPGRRDVEVAPAGPARHDQHGDLQQVHSYTEALLSAVPIPDPDLSDRRVQIVLEGDVPSPIMPPSGCRFHPRCRYATAICAKEEPPLTEYGSDGHLAACHHPLNIAPSPPPAPTLTAATDADALPVVPAAELPAEEPH